MNRPYISQQSIDRAELLVRTMRENKISLDPKGFGEIKDEVILQAIDELKLLREANGFSNGGENLISKYFSAYVDEEGNTDDKLSLTSEGFMKLTLEIENLVDVFFPDGEETMVPTDTSNYPDEEITLAEIRTELMRYLDNRANRGRS